MTALVMTAIALGALLALAGIGLPLWLAFRRPAPDAGPAQAQARLPAGTARPAAGFTVPAPRAPAAAETRPASRQAVQGPLPH